MLAAAKWGHSPKSWGMDESAERRVSLLRLRGDVFLRAGWASLARAEVRSACMMWRAQLVEQAPFSLARVPSTTTKTVAATCQEQWEADRERHRCEVSELLQKVDAAQACGDGLAAG